MNMECLRCEAMAFPQLLHLRPVDDDVRQRQLFRTRNLLPPSKRQLICFPRPTNSVIHHLRRRRRWWIVVVLATTTAAANNGHNKNIKMITKCRHHPGRMPWNKCGIRSRNKTNAFDNSNATMPASAPNLLLLIIIIIDNHKNHLGCDAPTNHNPVMIAQQAPCSPRRRRHRRLPPTETTTITMTRLSFRPALNLWRNWPPS